MSKRIIKWIFPVCFVVTADRVILHCQLPTANCQLPTANCQLPTAKKAAMGYARRGMDILLMVKLLCLLGAANGAPVVAAKLLGARFGRPLDGGWRFVDGRPLFGPSKTWRGLVVAVAGGAVVAVPLGWSWQLGAGVALAAMAGDLISSFIKRRLGLPSSSMCLGLDQVPEALLPL